MKQSPVRIVLTTIALALLSAGMLVVPHLARAETLSDTLATAQADSAQIAAAREAANASTAGVARAKAAFGPSVDLTASAGLNRMTAEPLVPTQTFRPLSAGVSLSMPLYTSGRLEALLSGAQSQSYAAAAMKDQAQQSALFDAANAYVNVALTEELQTLADHQVSLLEAELARAQAELKNGLRTRTDTAQAQARLAASQAQLRAAQAQAQSARVQYEAAVGRMPQGDLSVPSLVAETDLQGFVAAVMARNPQLMAQRAQVDVAASHVHAAVAENKPTVALSASLSRDRESNPVMLNEFSRTVGIQIRIPLFDNGSARASVAQAQAQRNQAQAQQNELARQLRANALSAWEMLQSAQAEQSARARQAQAAEVALEGARAEYKAGTRTLLDVLNAEQELLDARTAERKAAYERVSSILRMQALQGALAG